MRKIQHWNGSYFINIPMDLMIMKKWKKGTLIEFQYNHTTDEIKLVKYEGVIEDGV